MPKLKINSKGAENKEKVHREAQRRGKRNKVKGGEYERKVAEILKSMLGVEFVRTPQSGGFAKKSDANTKDFRGDVIPLDADVETVLHIECKNYQNWAMPKWIAQAESDCPKGKIPCVIFHKYGTSRDYIVLDLKHFLKIIHIPEVIIKTVLKPKKRGIKK